jgi:hypothetical protein
MIKQTLQRFLDSRFRSAIVTTVTCVIALAVIWPAADEYFALKDRYEKSSATRTNAEATLAHLDRFEAAVVDQERELDRLQQRSVAPKTVHEFREKMLELARTTGCQLRRARVGTPVLQAWKEGATPLDPAASQGAETGYSLRSLPFSLAVSGPLASVKRLLAEIHDRQKLMHTKSFLLRPEATPSKDVLLDMELMLFELVESEPQPR